MDAESVRFVNLTPHRVTIRAGEEDVVLPPSGTVARIREEAIGEWVAVVDGVPAPVREVALAAVEGLPEPEPGVFYLVSRVVAMTVDGRDDLVCPGYLIRDEEGRVVGADGLVLLRKG